MADQSNLPTSGPAVEGDEKYLDKVFQEPEFVWDGKYCNLDLVASTLLKQQGTRLEKLVPEEEPEDPAQSKLPTSKPAVGEDEKYLGKVFREPEFVWDGKYCDVDLVASTVLKQQELRVESLVPDEEPAVESAEEAAKPVRATRSAVMPLISDVLNAAEPINYHTQFHVGTEPITFFLDIDSGSSLLWLQAQLDTDDVDVRDQSMYRPSESRTSKDLELPTSASYGDGSRVSVSLYCDKIIAGGLTATCQVLGAAPSRKLSTSFKGSKANGIIGLGFGLAGSKTPSYPNLVQTLLSENAIKFASFSLIGPRNDPADAAKIDANAIKQPRGFFVIGAVSPDFYTGEIAWCPQTYDSNRWIVKLDAVRINETTAFTDQLALIDTGTALINTSPDTFGKILTLVPDSKLLPSRRMFSYPKSAIETISFVFSEREFKLSQEDLSLGRIKESATDRRCSSICRTGSSQWERCRFPDNLWVIGGIFLDNLVSIFDFEEKKIGFATISDKEDLNSTKYQAVEP